MSLSRIGVWGGLAFVVAFCAPAAEVVVLTPTKDAAIYAENGNNANGRGSFFFIGKNASGNLRRSLLHFDIAGAVPAGSTITGVTLAMTVANTQGTGNLARLLPLTQAWLEGPATPVGAGGAGTAAAPGDTTWTHHNFNTGLWGSAGGDFDNSVLTDTVVINGVGGYTWPSSTRLVSTVQAWLDTPATNFGWLIQGDETAVGATAKQVHARENATGAPQLTVTYLLSSYNPKVELAATFEAARLVGETIHYSLAISHDLVNGDGSDISGLGVLGDLSGAFAYASGDSDNDTLLETGETWVFTAQHPVLTPTPAPLLNDITVTFSDERGDPHTASTTLSTQVLALTVQADSPTLVDVGEDESASFTITVENGLAPITRQWYFDDGHSAPLALTGEDQLILSLSNLNIDQSGDYFCTVSTAFESVESPRFTLQVHPRIPLAGLCGLAGGVLALGLLGARQLRRAR